MKHWEMTYGRRKVSAIQVPTKKKRVTIEPSWPGKHHRRREQCRLLRRESGTRYDDGIAGPGSRAAHPLAERVAGVVDTSFVSRRGADLNDKVAATTPLGRIGTERAKKSACAGREYHGGSDTSKIGVTYLRHVDG
ncbi:hypothetical protein [Cupriavidus campinensis]